MLHPIRTLYFWQFLGGAVDDFCAQCESIEMNLVDCTNPLLPKLAGLDHRDELSGAEQIANKLPKANVLKSFNQTGAENMRLPPIQDKRKPVMFFTTDKSDIADLFNNLVEESGFDAQYVGELKHSKALEHLAFAWISLAMKAGMGRDISFYFKNKAEGCVVSGEYRGID